MRIAVTTITSACLLIFILSAAAFGGDAGRESQFSIGSGVRAIGMGGGFVGMADDASAIYWNQAGLALLEYQEVSFMHVTLFEGSIYDVATYAYPHPKLGGFGISFMRLGTGDIVKRVDWVEEDEFSYSISQLILGYGRKFGGGFSVGTALKIVNQSLDNNSAYGFGLDLSLLKSVTDNMTTGIIFQDIIAPHLRLSNSSDITPHTIIIGVGLRNPLQFDAFNNNFNVAVEFPEDRSPRLHFGVETRYERYDLRAGYDRDNLAFGFGVNHQRFRFDYAYRIMDGITDSHRLGLSFKIGTSISDKIRYEIELREARGSHFILDDRKRQFDYYKQNADQFYEVNDLDSALSYYHRALAYREDDPDVLARIESINRDRELMLKQEKALASSEEVQQFILDEYYNQAMIFLRQEQYTAALNLVDHALAIVPDELRFLSLKKGISVSVAKKVGSLLMEASQAENEGRLCDAVMTYNQILKLSPENVIAAGMLSKSVTSIDIARSNCLGVESYYLDELSNARRNFEAVLNIDKNNIIAREYINKIAALSRQTEALESKDLKQDVEAWKIYLNALQHYQNGEYEEAIKLWKQILEKYPGNEETLENIRQAELRMHPGE